MKDKSIDKALDDLEIGHDKEFPLLNVDIGFGMPKDKPDSPEHPS